MGARFHNFPISLSKGMKGVIRGWGNGWSLTVRIINSLGCSFIFLLQIKHVFGVTLGRSDFAARTAERKGCWPDKESNDYIFLVSPHLFFLLLLLPHCAEQGQRASAVSRAFHGGARSVHFREDLQGSSVSAGDGPGTACGHKDPQRHFHSPAVGWLPAGKELIATTYFSVQGDFFIIIIIILNTKMKI